MGVYEIITGITKNEENLKVEIRQTEGTLERNLVYIKNTKTNRACSFTLADGDEYGADAMTRNAVAKLHSDMYGCNEKTLDRIEHALGIKLETWQSEYILSQGITYPHEGRRTGKTLAYQIKTLLTAHDDITIYGNEEQYYVDEIHGSVYEKKLCHRPCKTVRTPSQSWHRSSESDIETGQNEKKGGRNAMELKGQVTISIEDFEKLKATAEQKEYAENQLQAFRDRMSQFYELDDTDFQKRIEEIDSTPNMSDRQIDKAISEARKTLKIVIDTDKLKKQIRASINKKEYKEDDSHIDLKNTTDSELDAIEICFREKED